MQDELKELFDKGREAQQNGQWDAALTAFETLLSRLPRDAGEWAVEILRHIGAVRYYSGDLELAEEVLSASCASAAANGSLRHLASGLNFLATVYQSAGDLDRAEETYRRAGDVAEQAGHERLQIMIEQNLGTIANVRGDSVGALLRYRRVLQHYTLYEDLEGMAWVLNNIGMVHTRLQAWHAAERAFDEALRCAEHRADLDMLGTVHLNRAELYLQQALFDRARDSVDQAFDAFGRLGGKQGLAEAYKLYGSLFRATGHPALADAHLSAVSELAEASDYVLLEAEARAEHALVHLDLGRSADALRALNRAHRLFNDLRARHELVDIDQRLDSLEDRYLQVVQVWGESIESKDRYTAGHCSRVAELTVRLAEAVGFTGRDLTWIRMGAFLHDVGKTAVDAAILNKTGKLDEREWEEMRNHTVAGDAIVGDLEFPWDIRPIVRNHHERWDGSGYPDGIAGEEIPLTARILCVADVYDALTTTRSYRPAHSPAAALEIMDREAGTVLDPRLYETFRALLRSDPALLQLEAS